MEPVSCVVPNFNGEKLLPAFLARLIAACDLSRDEIIVVDDCSRDASVEHIGKNFPAVRVIRLEKNQGFAGAADAGMKAAVNRLACVLNTDIEVDKGFLAPLCRHFREDNVLAVSASEVVDHPLWALPVADFRLGLLYYRYAPLPGPLAAAVPVLFAPGTCTLYDRDKFLSLGGFDTLFRPFYFEDMDLCLRGWKRGWRSLYEPDSRFLHKGQATITRSFAQRSIKAIHWKNRFLFIWKNIRDPLFILQHLAFLPGWLLLAPLAGRGEIAEGFFRALPQLAEALRAGSVFDPQATFSERGVMTAVRNGRCCL